jgi:hypothetical protein
MFVGERQESIDGTCLLDCIGICSLVNIEKAIENGPVEIVDLPIKHSNFQ